MSSDTEEEVFWEMENTGFAEPTAECDFLHPEAAENESDDALGETHYFGFSVPEENIHALTYMWHHTNLGVVMGGAWAWQGIKGGPMEAELFDMVTYASDDCLANDLHDYTLPNGYHVQTLEPLRNWRLEYEDASRGNRFEIDVEAIMPAMVLGNGHHLEQAIRTTGSLTLAGKDYDVDCFHVRDRTWAELRKDTLVDPIPPIDWMNGVFGEDFAFGATALDTEDPHWAGVLEPPPGNPLKIGWLWRDGELQRLTSVRKRSTHDPRTLFPQTIEMELTEENGRNLEVRAEIIATCPWNAWLGQESVICLARWECEGRVGHGAVQRGLRPDYIRMFRGR